jgi:dihydrofolate reductase
MEYRDAEVEADALERLADSDALVMGKGTYEVFAATWPGQRGNFAERQADWSNSVIVRGDAVAETTRLKQRAGQETAIFGHGLLAQTLLGSGLTDEIRLSIHPVIAGRGAPLFREGQKRSLKLVGSRALGTGVIVLFYQPESA